MTSAAGKTVGSLVEGNGIHATARMTSVTRNTITKLLVDLGEGCMHYHDQSVQNVYVKHPQCDEVWAYMDAKARDVSTERKELVGVFRLSCNT